VLGAVLSLFAGAATVRRSSSASREGASAITGPSP
jgi:hypothetical protein